MDVIPSFFSYFPPYFYRDPSTAYIGTSSVPFIDNSRAPDTGTEFLNISANTKYYSKSFGEMVDNEYLIREATVENQLKELDSLGPI